jgi:hypothetical protein
VQAQDTAIEDALDVLSSALMGGTMSLDVYVRSYRLLAEEQYKCRLLGMKVHERQQSRQRSNGNVSAAAAPVQPVGYPSLIST